MEIFNTENGFYMRSGIMENNKDTGIDPFMRNMPGLIDIGIKGNCNNTETCKAAGIDCYQGLNFKPDMALNDYKKIIDECKSSLFQVALGGHGDPNKHAQFKEILEYTKTNGVIPNYTTSGINLTDEEVALTKEYCGACAVSWQRAAHTEIAINKFIEAGVKTNIHYVLGEHTVDEAIERLTTHDWPKGINAILFLLYKPVGLGVESKMLKSQDKITKFFELIDNHDAEYKIGFDSCTIPMLIQNTSKINLDSVDTCEGARFSMYITADMVALPCSFDQDHQWDVDLKDKSIKEAWESHRFNSFRNLFKQSCPTCPQKALCLGGCPITNRIVTCSKQERVTNIVH